MSDLLTIDFAQPMPLFPLPQCVLLPHATIPLHIFEPRYRRMIADVMDSHGLIALASFAGDAWKQDYGGAPPVRPHVCLGYILRHESMDDGRSNIFLQGVCRARIHHEVVHSPYRMAVLEPTEPQPLLDIDLADHRDQVEKLMTDPALAKLAAVSAMRHWLNAEIPTHALIDMAIMNLSDDPEQRYTFLAEPDARARARWLEKLLRDFRRLIRIAQHHSTLAKQLEVTLN